VRLGSTALTSGISHDHEQAPAVLALTADPSRQLPAENVQRVEIATDDPDAARAHLHRLYGARMGSPLGSNGGPVLELTEVRTSRFRTGELRLPPTVDFRVRGQSELVVAALWRGEVDIDEGGRSEPHRAGGLLLANWPGARFRCRTRDVHALVVAIRFDLLGELAGIEPDSVAGLRFESRRPTSEAV